MANWVASFLAANPQYAAMPIAKRDRHSIHFRRPDGLIEAQFTGMPMHYDAGGGNWLPLDTALRLLATSTYGATGIPIRITLDRLVSILGSPYAQRTTRVGLYRPSTDALLRTVNVPLGSIQDDSVVATGVIGGANWEHQVRLQEDGIRETLTLASRPSIPQTQANDWLVFETAIYGVSWPNGDMTEYETAGYIFGFPNITDAEGNAAPLRRLARNIGGIQYLYTGIPVSWLATAVYPVVFDPDFAGSTADGYIYGENATYATARSTSVDYDSTGSVLQVGQRVPALYYVFRSFLKFDTSAIGAGSTVTQVNLKLVCTTDNSDTDFDVDIMKQDWSAQDPLSSANREAAYDNCLAGTLDDNIWRNTAGMSLNAQYASGNLNCAWINKVGNTYYSLLSSRDLAGTTPTGDERIRLAPAEHATAAYRPVLTVLYSAGGAITKNLAELLNLSELGQKNGAWRRHAAETANLAEVGRPAMSLRRWIAETVNLGEAVANLPGVLQRVAEALNLGEAAQRRLALRRHGAEMLGLYEMAPKFGTWRRLIAETLSLGEATGRRLSVLRLVADTLQLGEATRRLTGHLRWAAETMQLAEAALRHMSLRRRVVESLNLADIGTNLQRLARAIAEAMNLGDTASRRLGLRRFAIEAANLAEATLRSLSLRRMTVETLGLAEAMARHLSLRRFVSDVVSLAEATWRGLGLRRHAAETLRLGEVWGRMLALCRWASDALQLAEATVRPLSLRRLSSEAVWLSEVALRGLSLRRLVAETINLGDAASRWISGEIAALVRFAVESLRLSEAVSRSLTMLRLVAESLRLADAWERAKRPFGRLAMSFAARAYGLRWLRAYSVAVASRAYRVRLLRAYAIAFAARAYRLLFRR